MLVLCQFAFTENSYGEERIDSGDTSTLPKELAVLVAAVSIVLKADARCGYQANATVRKKVFVGVERNSKECTF